MNKVISEILFNRGLIWIMLAYLRTLHEDANSKWTPFMFLILAVYNFYKSWKTFGTEE